MLFVVIAVVVEVVVLAVGALFCLSVCSHVFAALFRFFRPACFVCAQVSVNMPSIEVGTIGGGTSLPAQAACLDIVGCRGATKAPGRPGENAQQMAK